MSSGPPPGRGDARAGLAYEPARCHHVGMRWLLALLALAGLAGCAGQGLDRADMDREIYAHCVRSGGIWYGDQQFGGSCHYQGHFR